MIRFDSHINEITKNSSEPFIEIGRIIFNTEDPSWGQRLINAYLIIHFECKQENSNYTFQLHFMSFLDLHQRQPIFNIMRKYPQNENIGNCENWEIKIELKSFEFKENESLDIYDKIVIETDNDTISEDETEIQIPAYDIEIGETPFSIFEYIRQIDKKKIIVQPDFQRNQVWKLYQKSQFIESVLLNYPLPPIYLNERKNSTYVVIDGLQRSTSFYDFYHGKYPLNGLETLRGFNGLRFNDLPDNMKSKIEDKKLTVYILKPSTPLPVIYDLFNRINTGGTPLNRQEVRNGIFIGLSTILLKNLSEKEYFKKAIDYGISGTRMKDREVILRYISFRWFDYSKEYTGDMSKYLEDSMRKINDMVEHKILEMEKDFERVMKWSFDIWDKSNFRIPTDYTKGTINTAILETVCNYLSLKSDKFLKANAHIIKTNYTFLISNNTYYEAVTKSTGNKAKVIDRFKLCNEILNNNTYDK